MLHSQVVTDSGNKIFHYVKPLSQATNYIILRNVLTFELKSVSKGQAVVSELNVGFYDFDILLPQF